MVQYYDESLNRSFAALADPTRRGILELLGTSNASMSDLADRFAMTLTGIRKHVAVLEEAGLVTTRKAGRVRTCSLGHQRMKDEAAWIERYRQRWEERFEALDRVLANEMGKETDNE